MSEAAKKRRRTEAANADTPLSVVDLVLLLKIPRRRYCASVRSAGASLLRGSAKKGASAARAPATSAKVKTTTAVKDEEQP